MFGSSRPFEANLNVSEITIGKSDNYKATFSFDLNKVLTGISIRVLELGARSYIGKDGKKLYVIWKGGSVDEHFMIGLFKTRKRWPVLFLAKDQNKSF